MRGEKDQQSNITRIWNVVCIYLVNYWNILDKNSNIKWLPTQCSKIKLPIFNGLVQILGVKLKRKTNV